MISSSRTKLSACALAIVLTAFVVSFGAAQAASLIPSKKNICRFVLAGNIEAGDLDQVRRVAVVGKLFVEGESETQIVGDENAAICLNSPGGSFIEAVALAKFFSEKGIATVIDEGAECLSACAIVFMAGRTHGAEEDYTNRKLHVRGILGFHRPFLFFSNDNKKKYSESELIDSSNFLISAVTFMLSLGNEKGAFDIDNRMKPSLIQAMLEKQPHEFLFVDTVDKAGRWGISLFGNRQPIELSKSHVYNACSNFIAWSIDQSNTDDYDSAIKMGIASVEKLQQNERPSLADLIESYKVFPGKNGYVSVYCIVNVYKNEENGKPLARICAADDFIGVSYGSCYSEDSFDLGINPISFYSPQTRLPQIGE